MQVLMCLAELCETHLPLWTLYDHDQLIMIGVKTFILKC